MLDTGSIDLLPMREGGLLHDHGHDHGHGHDDDHAKDDGHDDHGNEHEEGHEDEHDDHADRDGPVDPHAWLDPDVAAQWLSAIAEALTRIDPANAATYAANATAGRAGIEARNGADRDDARPVRAKRFAVAHDAFQYFENRFGVSTDAALTAGDGDRAGARRVQAVRNALTEGGIDCLFAEPGGDLPDRLTDGTSVRVLRIDPWARP